jgi:hypothetical protein
MVELTEEEEGVSDEETEEETAEEDDKTEEMTEEDFWLDAARLLEAVLLPPQLAKEPATKATIPNSSRRFFIINPFIE